MTYTHDLHRRGCDGTDDDLKHFTGNRGDHMTRCALCGWLAVHKTPAPATPDPWTLAVQDVTLPDGRVEVRITANGQPLVKMDLHDAWDVANALADTLAPHIARVTADA